MKSLKREASRMKPIALALIAAVAASFAMPRSARAQEKQPETAAAKAAARLQSLVEVNLAPIRYSSGDDPRAASAGLDDSGWQTWKSEMEFPGNSVWVRIHWEVPARVNGYDIRGSRLRLALDAWNADTVRTFADGVALAEGEEGDPLVLAEHAQPGRQMVIAIHTTWLEWKWTFRGAKVLIDLPPGRPDPGMLGKEFLVSEAMLRGLAPGDSTRAAALDAAIAAVNWNALTGDQAAFDRSLEAARAALEPVREWMQQYTIHAAGNSHIDMGWLWPTSETTMVVQHTWSSALQLMKEFPGLTYTHSSAAAYEWMEEKYPSLFEEIRKRVKDGRWEIIGGMWVEPDLNMPDGESLVRQLLLGKRYFQEKFGVDVRTGWNPDSFGYNWQLPQIYKKSGVDFFVTQKMQWNDTTKPPHKLFWWQSPDGSRVLTYFPHDYANPIRPVEMAKDLAAYVPDMHYPDMLYLFGVGDHGGGPTRDMLETAQRWQRDAVYPKLEFGAAQPWFDELAKKAPSLNLPVWNSELYFQYHRGVFTTQAETKKGNRRSEELMLTAEKFSAIAAMNGGAEYPAEDFRVAWKKILFNQFHDIAAGSGISVLYKDAARDYAEVRHIGSEHLDAAFRTIVAHVNTQGSGAAIVVFNPLAWTRTGVVEVDVQLPAAAARVRVVDTAGRTVLAQKLSAGTSVPMRLRFLAEDVPSVGYKIFRVLPEAVPVTVASTLKAGPDFLENEFFRVRVDAKTGCITSLFDRQSQWESVPAGGCANELQSFVDKPKAWDAWNIDADFEDHQWHLDQADSVELVERGPLRAVIRVKKHFQNSTFVQDLTLYPHIRRLDVRMTADWHEKHILLKVAFPVAVESETASYEIPFGSIQRPTTRRTPEERAQFEVPALRWADLSDAKHGLSLLNDSKYGYDGHNNVLRLSLLRSPEWPDPHADEGKQEFTYSLVPHAGGWHEAATVRLAYELNSRLRAVAAPGHAGSLPAVHSFVALEPANLLLTAMKQAEGSADVILRFYEFAGQKTTAKIALPSGVSEVWDASLMEQPGEKLATDGKTVSVDVKPYEIKTLRLHFSSAAAPEAR